MYRNECARCLGWTMIYCILDHCVNSQMLIWFHLSKLQSTESEVPRLVLVPMDVRVAYVIDRTSRMGSDKHYQDDKAGTRLVRWPEIARIITSFDSTFGVRGAVL